MASQAYPRAIRIRTRSEFQQINRNGLRIVLADVIVRYKSNKLGYPRFGLTVSRRVGNAVIRNQVKRHLREAIRHERVGVGSYDVVVIAKPSTRKLDHLGFRRQVHALCQKLQRP